MALRGRASVDELLGALAIADRQLATDILHAVDLCTRANRRAASLDSDDVVRRTRAERLEHVLDMLERSLS